MPIMLAFAVLMDLALLGMDISMAARGVPGGGQRIALFAVMGAVNLTVLWLMLRKLASSTSFIP